jgi:hypothetical protein
MTKTYVMFRKEGTNDVFLWNGHWPISVSPSTEGWNGDVVTKQEDGTIGPTPLNPDEEKLFTSLESNRKQVFELKGRGRFTILQRIKIELEDE